MIVDEHLGSLEEQVYARLEEDILSGALPKGQILTECELAAMLGVSRTPVRGALRRLTEEGLVAMPTNKRATVVGISIDDLIDTYQIRTRLEGLSSRLAAERMSDEEKAKLSHLPTSLDEALDALERDNDYLTAGGVFPKELLTSFIARKRAECRELAAIPHPAEFDKYYNL